MLFKYIKVLLVVEIVKYATYVRYSSTSFKQRMTVWVSLPDKSN